MLLLLLLGSGPWANVLQDLRMGSLVLSTLLCVGPGGTSFHRNPVVVMYVGPGRLFPELVNHKDVRSDMCLSLLHGGPHNTTPTPSLGPKYGPKCGGDSSREEEETGFKNSVPGPERWLSS